MSNIMAYSANTAIPITAARITTTGKGGPYSSFRSFQTITGSQRNGQARYTPRQNPVMARIR